jgi:1-acyl-sn-glycerol-3-phosphate acyltransferase
VTYGTLADMFKRFVGRTWLAVTGWAFEGPMPPAAGYVAIAAPHTSNWDFVHMLAMAWAQGLRFRWMGKASLFAFPLGTVMRAFGGIPIERSRRGQLVAQCAAHFAADPGLVLAVPAEGTRGPGTHWRSGFYHIARTARVPIVLGYLDYARRRGGLGAGFVPSGDLRADMDRIRAFYADKVGRHPTWFTPPRLVEEDEPADRG